MRGPFSTATTATSGGLRHMCFASVHPFLARNLNHVSLLPPLPLLTCYHCCHKTPLCEMWGRRATCCAVLGVVGSLRASCWNEEKKHFKKHMQENACSMCACCLCCGVCVGLVVGMLRSRLIPHRVGAAVCTLCVFVSFVCFLGVPHTHARGFSRCSLSLSSAVPTRAAFQWGLLSCHPLMLTCVPFTLFRGISRDSFHKRRATGTFK